MKFLKLLSVIAILSGCSSYNSRSIANVDENLYEVLTSGKAVRITLKNLDEPIKLSPFASKKIDLDGKFNLTKITHHDNLIIKDSSKEHQSVVHCKMYIVNKFEDKNFGLENNDTILITQLPDTKTNYVNEGFFRTTERSSRGGASFTLKIQDQSNKRGKGHVEIIVITSELSTLDSFKKCITPFEAEIVDNELPTMRLFEE